MQPLTNRRSLATVDARAVLGRLAAEKPVAARCLDEGLQPVEPVLSAICRRDFFAPGAPLSPSGDGAGLGDNNSHDENL